MEKIKSIQKIAYIMLLIIPILLTVLGFEPFDNTNKNWILGILTALYVICVWVDYKHREILEKTANLEEDIKEYEKILDKSFDIFNEKERVIINEIKQPKHKKDVIKYDVHEHMRFITSQLKDCICDITRVDSKHLSVHLMYKHTNDVKEDWKWIDGNNISVSHTLKKIINNENSCYYRILHTNDKFIFENDKMEAIAKEEYVSSDKDKYYGKIGSIICSKIDCGRYGESYIEAVLSISSYGKKFVEDNDKKRVEELKSVVKHKILPYYNALLEVEMASLSLRHSVRNKDNAKVKMVLKRLRSQNKNEQ